MGTIRDVAKRKLEYKVDATEVQMTIAALLISIVCANARALPSQQTILSFDLDIYFRSTWVGETATRVVRTEYEGKAAYKSVRTTRITVAMGRIKPMFTELEQLQNEAGDPITLRYTYSSGIESQTMCVRWERDKISVERTGFDGSGLFEPVHETVEREKAKQVGGSPLDSLLLGRAGKQSSVALSMDFESKKLEEHRIEYVGDAQVFSGSTKKSALEYRVMKGKATLYRVFLEDRTDVPLRIESIDGLLMIPKKKP